MTPIFEFLKKKLATFGQVKKERKALRTMKKKQNIPDIMQESSTTNIPTL